MKSWQELAEAYIMHTAKRLPVTLVRGQGVRVWDDTGKAYLDFVAGWAADCLGHCHPATVEALMGQARNLVHTSNQFYTIPQVRLARLLVENSCCQQVFFCNSGAEANEGAVKLARKYGKLHRDGAYEVITALNSFHGRTLAMVAATGQEKFQTPYTPLPAGFINVEYDSIEAIKEATTEHTIAVMLEPIQGEGGVILPKEGYLREVRKWCDERGLLLILDEVQTGMGRIGSLFAYQQYGVEPDILTLAKGLGGGVPIGAFLAKEAVLAFEPGDHGSTFGGNPLACAVAHATLHYLIEHDIPSHVRRMGEYLMERLRQLQKRFPSIKEMRGRGLLVALEFDSEVSQQVVETCLEMGLLTNPVSAKAVRFMPPLIVSQAEVEEALEILERALTQAGMTGTVTGENISYEGEQHEKVVKGPGQAATNAETKTPEVDQQTGDRAAEKRGSPPKSAVDIIASAKKTARDAGKTVVSWADQPISGGYALLSRAINSSKAIQPPTAKAILEYVSSAYEASAKSGKKVINHTAIFANAILASDFSREMESWLGHMLNEGIPSKYDAAVDAVYNATHVGGGHLHRLFDGSHTLWEMWDKVGEASHHDNFQEEVIGYATALGKDLSSYAGIPLFDWSKTSYDQVAEALVTKFGVPRPWFADLLHFNATEVVGTTIGAIAIALNWNKKEAREFASLAGSLGISSIASANPLLAVVTLVALAKSFVDAKQKGNYSEFVSGLAKGGVGTGAFLVTASAIGGPTFVGILSGICVAAVVRKRMDAIEVAQISTYVQMSLRKAMAQARLIYSGAT